jgi:TM2 domain-containing membrane protein YozV
MHPNFQEQNSSTYFRMLSMIHGGLLIILILFAIVCYFYQQSTPFAKDIDDLNEIFKYLLPALTVVVTMLSFKRYGNHMAQLTGIENFKIRLGQYKIYYISHLSMFVGVGIFAIVAFMSTAVWWYLVITALMAAVLFWVRPTREKVASDVQLNHKEKMLLDDPDAIIAIVRVTN